MNRQKLHASIIFPWHAAALVLAVCLLPGCNQQPAQSDAGRTDAQVKAEEARARLSASEGGTGSDPRRLARRRGVRAQRARTTTKRAPRTQWEVPFGTAGCVTRPEPGPDRHIRHG